MESPLGPVLPIIFMVELENSIVPVLRENLFFWKQYVDDTICFGKIGIIYYITTILNNFDPNITFAYEVQKDNKLPFLDMILIKKGNKIVVIVYFKATTDDIYLNWKSFASTTWKRGIFNGTSRYRGHLICSNIALRKKEIEHLKKVFHKKFNYLKWAINQVLNEVKLKHKSSVNNVSEESHFSPVTDLKHHNLVLSYQSQKGDFIIKSMNNRLKTLLPDNVKTDIAFQGKQLSSCSNIKDKTKFLINMIWFIILQKDHAEESCNDDYVIKTARHISEEVLDRNGRDKNSHIL